MTLLVVFNREPDAWADWYVRTGFNPEERVRRVLDIWCSIFMVISSRERKAARASYGRRLACPSRRTPSLQFIPKEGDIR